MMFTVTAGTTYHFQVDHLSETNPANNDFVLNLYYRVPTSSEVSVGGKVTDSNGNALGKVRINLTRPSGEVLSAISNPFGYYLIEGADVGQTYTLEAQKKGVQFQNNPRVLLNVIDDLRDEDFIAEPANVKKLE